MSEWILLNKNIEKGKFSEEKLEALFLEHADIPEDGDENTRISMSFDKFAVISVELKLFTDDA